MTTVIIKSYNSNIAAMYYITPGQITEKVIVSQVHADKLVYNKHFNEVATENLIEQLTNGNYLDLFENLRGATFYQINK